MSDDHDVTFTEELSGELALTGQAIDTGRVVRPGDVLVVSTTNQVTGEQAAQLRRDFTERFPDLADVVVASQVRFEFVYRNDDEQ